MLSRECRPVLSTLSSWMRTANAEKAPDQMIKPSRRITCVCVCVCVCVRARARARVCVRVQLDTVAVHRSISFVGATSPKPQVVTQPSTKYSASRYVDMHWSSLALTG